MPANCQHTPCPSGYLQWHAWAARMLRTHKQVRCPHCGLWAIWLPRNRRTDLEMAVMGEADSCKEMALERGEGK